MAIDKIEKRIIISSMMLMGLFVFSILYAKSKYKTNVPECLPYNKAYEEPKINKLDEKMSKLAILRKEIVDYRHRMIERFQLPPK